MRPYIRSHFENYNLFAFLRLYVTVLGIKRSSTLTTPQVGNSDSRQHSPLDLVRREGAGTTQHDAGHASFRKRQPQRYTLAVVNDLWRSKNAFRLLKTAKRSVWKVGCRIPGDEIKNSVPAGIGSCRERRPCHRSLSRIRRSQPRIETGIPNAGQVGKFSTLQHGVNDSRLESIESDYDCFFRQ